jgi:uncharacterized iron-regulated membrane protein
MLLVKGFLTEPRRTVLRKVLFQLHLWTGLAVGLIAAVVGMSGAALVFREEIERTIDPATHIVTPGEGFVAFDRIVTAARAAHPEARLQSVELDRKPGHAVAVRLLTGGGKVERRLTVAVNPHTGSVVGRRPERDQGFINWLADLHFNLLAGETGLKINGVAAGWLAVLCLTGAVIWFPGRGKFGRSLTIGWGKGRWRVNWGLHNVAGLLVCVVLGAVAVTGIYFAFYESFEEAVYTVSLTPKPVEPKSVSPPDVSVPVSIDALWNSAREGIPDGTPTSIYFPTNSDDAAAIYVRTPGDWSSYGSSVVWLDARDGKTLRVDDLRKQPLATRFLYAQSPIHFGTFGGLATRILWIPLGLSPGLLFLTGFLMWWRRVVARRWKGLKPAQSRNRLPFPEAST